MNTLKRFIGKVKNLFKKEIPQANILISEPFDYTEDDKDYTYNKPLYNPEVKRRANYIDRHALNKKHRNRLHNKQARISRRINRAA